MIGRCCEPPCPPRICARVRDCGGVAISGATVSVAGPDGFTASGTTDATGWWCADAGDPGDYVVTVDDGTYEETKTVAVSAPCTSYTAAFCLGGARLSIGVQGCNVLTAMLPGASVTVTQGAFSHSYTSSGSVREVICVPTTDDVTITATKTRYADKTITVKIQGICATTLANVGMAPASGYHCFCECEYPAADTLYLTDSALGCTATLTWTPSGSGGSLGYGGGWTGSATVASIACVDAYGVGCPSMMTTVSYEWNCEGSSGIVGINTIVGCKISWTRYSVLDPAIGCPGPNEPHTGIDGPLPNGAEGMSICNPRTLTCPPSAVIVLPMTYANPIVSQTGFTPTFPTPYGHKWVAAPEYGANYVKLVKCDGSALTCPVTTWTISE